MLLPTCRWRPLQFALLLVIGVTTTSWRASGNEIELEVLGKLSLHAQTRTLDDGSWELSGQISDEAGRPLAGQLRLKNKSLQLETLRSCDAPEASGSAVANVNTSGEFCLITSKLQDDAQLFAEAPHFPLTSISIYEDRAGRLPSPRFTQAPQVLDLDKSTPVVVEILASSGSYPHGAELSLALSCESRIFLLAKTELTGSQLERFEFAPPTEAHRGNCQFIAKSTAPNHPPQSDSRNVLVRSQARFLLKNAYVNDERFVIEVETEAEGGLIEDGLVEARSNGVFLVGAPLKNGRGRIELELATSTSVVEVGFVPSGPALLATDPLTITIPARQASFQLTGLHILLLLTFCFWLGYAWLRPSYRRKRPPSVLLPKKSLLRASPNKKGPIEGIARDAHTGQPIAGVRLTILEAGVDEKRIVEEQTTNSDGIAHFETSLTSHPLLQLQAAHVSYMNLLAPIHGTGLTIHLTERRRAVLKNLVSWARREGRPWNTPPRPTPGDIEDTARRAQKDSVANWAQQVARTAYGPIPPRERDVEELKRPPNRSPQQ